MSLAPPLRSSPRKPASTLCCLPPKEFKEDAQNAGSRLLLGDVGSWDLPASKHSNGLLKMAPSVDYIDSRQFKGIAPGKPGIYLTKNIKVSKGNLRKICWLDGPHGCACSCSAVVD